MIQDERLKYLLNEPVWGVMYRGNGYGPFYSKEMADDFAEFIPERNERKLGGNREYGLKATIHEFESLHQFLLTSNRVK